MKSWTSKFDSIVFNSLGYKLFCLSGEIQLAPRKVKGENFVQFVVVVLSSCRKMATVDFFKHNNKNKNTTSATNTWSRHYERWATETNRPSNIILFFGHPVHRVSYDKSFNVYL